MLLRRQFRSVVLRKFCAAFDMQKVTITERQSQTKGLLVDADGSVDAYFEPKAPAGNEKN